MKKTIQKRNWKFLLLEVFVVFLGMYGAFYLDNLREQENDRKNRVNYYETFLLNLDQLYLSATNAKEDVDSLIMKVENNSGYEVSVSRSIDFTNNMLIVRSGFEAENFTTIGKDYLSSLDRGSNLISIIEKRANILEEETRKFIIYGGGDEKKFKEWYLEELKYLSVYLERLQQTITKGAIPETRMMIKQIKKE